MKPTQRKAEQRERERQILRNRLTLLRRLAGAQSAERPAAGDLWKNWCGSSSLKAHLLAEVLLPWGRSVFFL